VTHIVFAYQQATRLLASVSSPLACLAHNTSLIRYQAKEHLMGDPYDTSAERTSVLGPTLRFKGELHADEELLIRGQIEGSITHSQRITVCGEGVVKANIRAQTIVVEGTVEGDLQAEKAVQIKETARLKGNVHAPSVSIIDGAQFNGGVAMDVAKRAAVANTHAGRPAKADAAAK
jgi:cytoskeletal protein CcmA (bactofilin family)